MRAIDIRISVIILAILCTAAAAKTIYVDDDASGANDGTSWENAYIYLQEALADAKSAERPVEIRVAQGVYKPNGGIVAIPEFDWRTLTFQLISGVTLKGGYAGAADPNARDIELYETTLSGDLNGNDAEVVTLPGLHLEVTRADNSYNVVSSYYSDESAVLNGFTITAGNAYSPSNESPYVSGGGMYIHESNPTVIDCTFVGNSAEDGGAGVNNIYSSPVVINCTFSRNSAGTSSGGQGGGMDNRVGSNPILTNCKFSSNWAGQGGGIHALCCAPITNSCIFTDNSANFGGGMQYKDSAGPELIGCTFSGNSAFRGAGIRFIHSSPVLTNCLFTDNVADIYGGAVAITNMSDPILANCTFTANAAPQGPALACDHALYGPSEVYITNSILWNKGGEIWNNDNSEIYIIYSDVQGRYRGEGNMSTDPLFADPNNYDYHLKSQAGRWDPNSGSWVVDDVTSPCIDAGDPNSPVAFEPEPHGGRINMGAYGGTAEASLSTDSDGMSLPRVVYIYDHDAAATDSFKSLLEMYGVSVTSVSVNNLEQVSLVDYDLIIVGDDAAGPEAFEDGQFVAAVEDSGKPVVGLGDGGYDFFGRLDLSIGSPNGVHGSKNSIWIIDPEHSLFSTPYPIDIPDDGILQLYTQTDNVSIYLWPEPPETVTAFAWEANDKGYYPLVMEHNRYLLWGFTESPEKMTEAGKILFINVVIRAANSA